MSGLTDTWMTQHGDMFFFTYLLVLDLAATLFTPETPEVFCGLNKGFYSFLGELSLRGQTSSVCDCISELKCVCVCECERQRQRVRDKWPVVASDWEDGLLWPHWSKSLTGSSPQSILVEVLLGPPPLHYLLPLFLSCKAFTPPTSFPSVSDQQNSLCFCLALVDRPTLGKQ